LAYAIGSNSWADASINRHTTRQPTSNILNAKPALRANSWESVYISIPTCLYRPPHASWMLATMNEDRNSPIKRQNPNMISLFATKFPTQTSKYGLLAHRSVN